eukprot:scaffold7414_cov61-Phaeocystis_antarctica.AAC.3
MVLYRTVSSSSRLPPLCEGTWYRRNSVAPDPCAMLRTLFALAALLAVTQSLQLPNQGAVATRRGAIAAAGAALA